MNRRNIEFILEENPRALFPLVDDKLQFHAWCARLGLPCPTLLDVVQSHGEIARASNRLNRLSQFVVKPARGSSGRGVVLVNGRNGKGFLRPNDQCWDREQMTHHLREILAGMYSLGGGSDVALVQERVQPHPTFDRIAWRGVPDIRVLLHRFQPVAAMLRLPTLESNGRANLHQGGIGVGIDLMSGITYRAVAGDVEIRQHPDSGEYLPGRKLPYWREIVEIAEKTARSVGLGFVGVDVVIDAVRGPLLLEANARPGLGIQLACGRGLLVE